MVTSHVHVAKWWILGSEHRHEQSFLFDVKGEKSRICICCLEHIHTHSHSFIGMCHRQLARMMCHFSSVSQPLSGTLSLPFLLLQMPILFVSEPWTGTRLDATGAYRRVTQGHTTCLKFYTHSYLSCKKWCAALHLNHWRTKNIYTNVFQQRLPASQHHPHPTVNRECANTNKRQISNAISFQSAKHGEKTS